MKRRILLGAVLGAAIGLAGGTSLLVAQGEAPYPDRAMGTWVTSRLEYAATPTTTLVDQATAILTARKFTHAPTAAAVQSSRLAKYNDPFVGPRLIWVIDLAGIDVTMFGGGLADPQPSQHLRRAVLFVSATQPDLVIAQYSLGSQ